MLASLSMDVASFIELLTPFFPGYFLPLASIANVGTYVWHVVLIDDTVMLLWLMICDVF